MSTLREFNVIFTGFILIHCNFAFEVSFVGLQVSYSPNHRQNFYNIMVNHNQDDESCTKPIGRCSVFYYGVGHMLNDITSACWFTYLLVFLTDIGLSPRFVTHFLAVRYASKHASSNDRFSIRKKGIVPLRFLRF